jgi:IMP dehydrogenase
MKYFDSSLTFDDVLLLPQYSEILPHETITKTNISDNISLNIPIMSAAMDTVTESSMAIMMALLGGIGIIHKNLNPDDQANEVAKVKRFENGFIVDPVVISPTASIQDVYDLRIKYGYKDIPVTKDGTLKSKLVGFITANSYFIGRHSSNLVKDRMVDLLDLFVAKEGITLEHAQNMLEESKYSKLLIIDNNGKLKAMVTRRDIERKRDFPNATLDSKGRLLCGAAVGPSKNMEERVKKLIASDVDVLVVDTAHGHSKGVGDTVRYIRKNYPDITIIGGNIATPEAVEFLYEAGVDSVKVGIGPGSICTTRVVTGIGVPQLSALKNCSEKAKELGIRLIADGGIKLSGDFAKAMAIGASCVMIGSLLAGTEESPGQLIYSHGKTYKSYRGMGSIGAMKKGGKERYGQANINDEQKFVPEGIEGMIVYKGSVRGEIYQLVGGLRSSMGYQGVEDIKSLHKNAKFTKITSSSMKESHPHDVQITQEAPNYKS